MLIASKTVHVSFQDANSPIIGIKSAEVFHVIGVDEKFNLYKHPGS